jgi:flagellin
MSLIVNTNIASMNSQRSLVSSAKELQTAMERLSSGKKINSAADDAAGFAIAERMTAQVRGLQAAVKNVNDGLSYLQTVDGTLATSLRLVQRINELSIQASNGTLSLTDKSNIQSEIRELIVEVDRIYFDTEFNGSQALPSGWNESTAIQVGVNDGDQIDFSLTPMAAVDFLAAKEGYALWSDAPFRTDANTDPPPNGLSASSFTISNSIGVTTIAIEANQTAEEIELAVNAKALETGVFARAYTWGFLEAVDGSLGQPLALSVNGYDIGVDSFSYEGLAHALNEIREKTGVEAYAYDWGVQLGNAKGEDIELEMGASSSLYAYAPWNWADGVTLLGGADDSLTFSGSVRFMSASEFTVDKIGDSVPTIFDSNPRTLEGHPSATNATLAELDSLTSYYDSQFGIIQSLDDANVEHTAWVANFVSRAAMNEIVQQRAEIGAQINRFNYTISNLMNVAENTMAAKSRIQDADFAVEAAKLAKSQVLQQTGTAMLAQANAQPQMILSLIR